jgi:transcription-repair coupling factor (superfamily II helicase)
VTWSYIAAVGFHLYTRLLADSVRRIRAVAGSHLPASASPFDALNLPLAMPVNVDLPLAIGIPAEYIPDQDLRLRLYRRIADLRDESEIDALASEFNDRFGTLPEMVQNLLYQMRIKLYAEKIGLASISMENGQIVLRYPPVPGGESTPHLRDLGPAVRGGKNAYWLAFGRDTPSPALRDSEHLPDWPERLLDVLKQLIET